MKRESYEKQLVRQKIQAHREIARLEMESVRSGNPLTSAFQLGTTVHGLLGNSALRTAAVTAIPAVLFALIRLWRRRSSD